MFISRIFPEAPREQVFSRTPQDSTQILFGLTVFKPFISFSFYTGTVIKNFRDLSKILCDGVSQESNWWNIFKEISKLKSLPINNQRLAHVKEFIFLKLRSKVVISTFQNIFKRLLRHIPSRIYFIILIKLINSLKVCVRYFLSNFISH